MSITCHRRHLAALLTASALLLGPTLAFAALDAVFANHGKRNPVCLGDGAGGFSCADATGASVTTEDVALGYVNGDAFLDVVFANAAQRNRVCLGDGAGGFTCSDVSPDTNQSYGVALGHLNGDTFLDAVFANIGLIPPQFNRVCLGDGAGGFSCTDVSPDTFVDTTGVAMGDVNGDSLLDAVFANRYAPARLCLGDGAGGFGCTNVNGGPNFTSGVALGDVGAPPPYVLDLKLTYSGGILTMDFDLGSTVPTT